MIFLQQVIKLLLLKSYNHHCLLGIRYVFNIVLENGLTNGHENLLLTLLPIISFINEPSNYKEVISSPQSSNWKLAMQSEY
jgi:hypothetical protein